MIEYKRPELVVNAGNLEEVRVLINAGANAILVGEDSYGLRIRGNFDIKMIKEAITIAHNNGVKIYVLMNALFHNNLLTKAENYINKLVEMNVDAVVFEDPAIYSVTRKISANLDLHLSAGTMATNTGMINFWKEKGIKRVELAKELSLDEVAHIKSNMGIEIQVQIHGPTSIFFSKRKLIRGYFKYLKNDNSLINSKQLYLKERERPEDKYPVFEDVHGTHIMNEHDICMVGHIDKFIDIRVDSFKIEGILYTRECLVKITEIYKNAIDSAYEGNKDFAKFLKQIEAIQPIDRPLGTGFYFKEQIY